MKIEYLSDNTPAVIGVSHIQPDHLFELKSFKKLLSDYQRDRLYKYVDALRGNDILLSNIQRTTQQPYLQPLP